MKRLDRNAFHWPDTPDELRQVTLKEIHWLCDGLSLNPRGAFEEHHPVSIRQQSCQSRKNHEKHGISQRISYIRKRSFL